MNANKSKTISKLHDIANECLSDIDSVMNIFAQKIEFEWNVYRMSTGNSIHTILTQKGPSIYYNKLLELEVNALQSTQDYYFVLSNQRKPKIYFHNTTYGGGEDGSMRYMRTANNNAD